jgi:hypothetical protein
MDNSALTEVLLYLKAFKHDCFNRLMFACTMTSCINSEYVVGGIMGEAS